METDRLNVLTDPAAWEAAISKTGKRCAVAIGKFDGVHTGHRKLLGEVLARRKEGLLSCVLSFDPLPEEFFGFGPDGYLTTPDEKIRILDEMGIDILALLPFDRNTAATDPEDFIRYYLHDRLHAAFVAAGDDLSFGDRGRGNFELLERLSGEYGYEALEIRKALYHGQPVSSTMIRSFVEAGEMEKACECLGAPYCVRGTVVHGRAFGRTMEIPTINIPWPEKKILPRHGVYFADICIPEEGRIFHGMANIGTKPTVEEHAPAAAEAYLFGTGENLYGKDCSISLLKFRRPERHFGSLEELSNAMHEDLRAGEEYFKCSVK